VARVLRPPLPIVTPRLLLRPFTPDDFDDAYAFHARPDVVRYLYWEPPTAEEFRDLLARKAQGQGFAREGDRLNLAVVPHDVGRVIGDVSLAWRSAAHRQGEIGFVLHPDQQGHGYAAEAARALLQIGFAGLGLHRIVGRLDARNTASARVLERLGMRREAHLVENEFVKGEWADELVYALLDREWAALNQP
jgi:RimJ/RimL family protein N-acetyltransferase